MNDGLQGSIRYAPSTTGFAHPGTLLAGLLCWLTARSLGVPAVLRLENIDPDRSKPDYERAMIDDLAWFGLEWDTIVYQSLNRPAHEAALDKLEQRQLLYPCNCSRSKLKERGVRAPDGGFAYDNACRGRSLPPGGWRACREAIRVKLPVHDVVIHDQSGLILQQQPVVAMGDPVVCRRDGAMAYHLACVVDDALIPVHHIIRGNDLLHSAPTQWLIQDLLQYPHPTYRHHFLLLDRQNEKLAKFHGAVGAPELRQHYKASELCGLLAGWCGINPDGVPCLPKELISSFDWGRVRSEALLIEWRDQKLKRIV